VLVPGVGEIAVLGVEAESYMVVAVSLLENVVYNSRGGYAGLDDGESVSIIDWLDMESGSLH